MTSKAAIAITMGDPSGIGPEITLKALMQMQSSDHPVFAIGAAEALQRAADQMGAAIELREITSPEEASAGSASLQFLSSGTLDPLPPLGKITAAGGQAAYDAIVSAISLARAKRIAAMVTAPIHKEALSAAGISYPGHTEILADHGGAERVAMMLANDEIRTVLVTVHCSLREAIDRADFDAQMAAMRLAREGAAAYGISNPRVAVAGLNPHAGEGGLFGDEEIRIIAPAIEAARKEGIDASGPWSGDTVFMQARQGRFDVVVAQYHDQGLIPVKYLGLEKGVNITLGLPFIRTSPDHGTAFDIAGTGTADAASLITAVEQASRMAAAREKDTPNAL